MGAKQFYHVHLISDVPAETLQALFQRAALAFSAHEPIVHVHALIDTAPALRAAMEEIEQEPGLVLHMLGDPELNRMLEAFCHEQGLSCMAVMDPLLEMLSAYLNTHGAPKRIKRLPLDEHYFSRMRALDFALLHDDGQNIDSLGEADIILLGLSRTSKTPTSVYLANHGLRTANVPFIDAQSLPAILFSLKEPLIVGLVASTGKLSHVRRSRLEHMGADKLADYAAREAIAREIRELRQLCERHGWPVIDVSRRAVEETAALIMNLHRDHARRLEERRCAAREDEEAERKGEEEA